jgi:N6-adenosine-specific RNA methylase IME4
MDVPALLRWKPKIDAIMAKHCAACFWVYGPRLPDTLKVLEGWGFTFKSELFVWVKITKSGRPHMGKGLTTRKFCETAWLATRGEGLPFHEHASQLIETEDDLPLIVEARKREHSRKPDEAYAALESMFGDVRRLDLFARQERAGWTSWGNEMQDVAALMPFAAADCA